MFLFINFTIIKIAAYILSTYWATILENKNIIGHCISISSPNYSTAIRRALS
jgi:hypothetical protein